MHLGHSDSVAMDSPPGGECSIVRPVRRISASMSNNSSCVCGIDEMFLKAESVADSEKAKPPLGMRLNRSEATPSVSE